MQLNEEIERGLPAQIPAFSVFHQTCLRNPQSAGREAEEGRWNLNHNFR
jgi:hypothetical protein